MSHSVEDPRFAELLRPIKDLTDNFNIPLSQFLDTYFLELRDCMGSPSSSLSPSPLDSQSKVNFVQAGLFIQGSVSVYSKKVEFLWQNVQEMLLFLAKRREETSRSTTQHDETETEKNPLQQKEEMISFSPIQPQTSKKTLLQDSHSSQLHFIPITPCQLIQKEGKIPLPFHCRVNIYAKGEVLGSKEDFRVNAQYSSDSGILGDGLVAGNTPATCNQLSISLFNNTETLPSSPPRDATQEIHTNQQDQQELPTETTEVVEAAADYHEADHLASIQCDDNEEREDRLRHSCRRDIIDSVHLHDKSSSPSSMPLNPWEPLKPSEAPPHPLPKATRKRLSHLLSRPCGPPDLKKSSSVLSKKTMSEYICQSKEMAHRPKRERIANIAPELRREAFQEEKRRKPLRNKLVTSSSRSSPHEEGLEDVNNNQAEDLDQPRPSMDDWDGLPDPHESDHPLLLGEENEGRERLSTDHQNSYEEMVLKKVGNYLTQSQGFVGSSELAKRVASWHEHIRPKLEAVETRGSFNIHSYGTKVLDTFPDDNRKSTLEFSSIVQNVEKEEVSRYFLSCLMLANTSNLELESQGMNDLSLTLLTTKRHHEELMASQEESQSQTTLSSKRKRGLSMRSQIVDESLHQEIMEELDAIPDLLPV